MVRNVLRDGEIVTVTAPAMEMERVLRRFVPVISDIGRDEVKSDLLGCVIDVETTGFDPLKDKIIQLSILPFRFTANGAVTAAGEALTFLEDPGCPIPEEITKLTGITDDDVRRKRIDDAQVCELASNAVMVIAHRAEFDRQFVEARLPLFKALRWSCSIEDVPWKEEGYSSTKLEWLAYKHCGLFYDGHRADVDCYMTLHLLSTVLPSGMRALACLQDALRTSYVRIHATGSPFPLKDELKKRGYESEYIDGKFNSWYRDVRVGEEYQAERKWLAEHALCHEPTCHSFNSRTRFSNRIGKG